MKKYIITVALLCISIASLGATTLREYTQSFLSAQEYNTLIGGEMLSNTLGVRDDLALLPPVEAQDDIIDDVWVLRGDIAMEFAFFVPFTQEEQQDPLWLLNQYLQIDTMTNATFIGSRSGEEARLFSYAHRVDSPKTLSQLPNLQFSTMPNEIDLYIDADMNKIGQLVLEVDGEFQANNELYLYLENTNTLKYSVLRFLKPENLHMHMVTKPLDDGILVYNAVYLISPSTKFLSAVGLGGSIESALYARMEGLSNWFRMQISN